MLPAVLLAGGLLAATLVRLAPGFAVDERELDPRLNASSRDAIARDRTADSNIGRYYWNYLAGLAHGDLGQSISLRRPVKELLIERAGTTLRSVGAGLAIAWAAALLVAIALEIFRRPLLDLFATFLSGGALCLPAAVLALVFLYLGAAPAHALAGVLFPRVFRYVRNVLRQAAGLPHVLAARARGVGELRIIAAHLLVPVAPELIALAGVSVSMAVGAAVPVEVLCDSPGVGQLIWQAAMARDLAVLVNVTLLIVALTLSANLLADAGRVAVRQEQA
jgi:ABC-type dipeptide/oligopeptide/nickel transport system permease component